MDGGAGSFNRYIDLLYKIDQSVGDFLGCNDK